MATPILSATALQRLNITSLQAWEPNQRQIDQGASDTVTLDALLQRQNALDNMVIEPATDPNKDYDVRIWWNDFCGQEAEDCNDDTGCSTLTGNPSQVDFKDYSVTQCLRKSFEIDESTFKGSFMTIEQNYSDNLRQAVRQILNALNKKSIAFLQANGGLNKGGQFAPTPAGQYVLPASDLANEQSKLYTKIIYDALKSRIVNPFLIDYGNFWHLNMNAQFNQGNADGKGDAARAQYFNVVSDIQGGSQLPTAGNSTFVIAPYAFAFVNKSYYQKRTHPINGVVSFTGSVPTYDSDSGKWKYYIEVPGYGIIIDVLHQRTCVNAIKDIYKHVFQLSLHYDFLLNPVGCEVGGEAVSGIIEYVKEGFEGSSSS